MVGIGLQTFQGIFSAFLLKDAVKFDSFFPLLSAILGQYWPVCLLKHLVTLCDSLGPKPNPGRPVLLPRPAPGPARRRLLAFSAPHPRQLLGEPLNVNLFSFHSGIRTLDHFLQHLNFSLFLFHLRFQVLDSGIGDLLELDLGLDDLPLVILIRLLGPLQRLLSLLNLYFLLSRCFLDRLHFAVLLLQRVG